MKRWSLLLMLVLLQCSFASAADVLDGFDSYVVEAMQERGVPGTSIAIIHNGDVLLSRGYGVTRLGGNDEVTATTRFPLASITKNFIATAIAILVEEEKLNWDDPVVQHLPELRFCDDYRTQHTTIRDLVCHRTGLERGDLLPSRDDVDQKQIVERVRYLQPVSGLREKFTYNNLMFYVLGEVIARTSGTSWEEFVRSRLLTPLNMQSTSTTRRAEPGESPTTIHQWIDEELQPVELPEAATKYTSPAGSIRSTSDDMAKWMLAAMAPDETNHRLLEFQTRRMMQTIHMSIPVTWNQEGNPYAARFYGTGLGWEVMDYRGRKLCFHGGSTGTVCAIMPEENMGVTILTTREWSQFPGMLMYDVLDALIDGPNAKWDREHWPFWKKVDTNPDGTREKKLAEAREELDAEQPPEIPTARFAGTYRCDLYGDLRISLSDDQLMLTFGANPPQPLAHWNRNTFYVRHPVRSFPHDDWFMEFQVVNDSSASVRIRRLSSSEPIPPFQRAAQP
ncbi:MAG: serine hydrolase [Planctomycetaceae bacterium]|nr:serine hydrolase [Planctomycetales bacterium]MCB9926441.1 serine hydrolase [Planctomycetaceae bacterium]